MNTPWEESNSLSVAYHYPPCFRLQGKSDCPVAVRRSAKLAPVDMTAAGYGTT